MTIPNLTQEELLALLKLNGWLQVSNSDWDTHKRIMMGNGKDSFPLELKGIYYYPHVVKLCASLGISAPEDHQRCYDQYYEYRSKTKDSDEEE